MSDCDCPMTLSIFSSCCRFRGCLCSIDLGDNNRCVSCCNYGLRTHCRTGMTSNRRQFGLCCHIFQVWLLLDYDSSRLFMIITRQLFALTLPSVSKTTWRNPISWEIGNYVVPGSPLPALPSLDSPSRAVFISNFILRVQLHFIMTSSA